MLFESVSGHLSARILGKKKSFVVLVQSIVLYGDVCPSIPEAPRPLKILSVVSTHYGAPDESHKRTNPEVLYDAKPE